MKKTISCIVITLAAWSALAQDPYAPVLEQIEQNSTLLCALKQQMEAQKLSNMTGLTPEDPEVEFGYLWGSPIATGNRQDLSVTQSFDFPSVYAERSRLAQLQNSSAEYQYKSQRMELLLSAKNLCIELVYYNALEKIYERQLENARRIAAAYEQMIHSGGAGRIEYNKAILNLANMENEVKSINIERNRLLSELVRLNGGVAIEFDQADYDCEFMLPQDFESWYEEAEAVNPALQYLKSEVEVSMRQVNLTQASTLPKLSIGYTGEFVPGQNYQGVVVGISIPLWENKNKVRQAKAAAKASEQMALDSKLQYYNHLKYLYEQLGELKENVSRYELVFGEDNSDELLYSAYSSGEMSLLDYLLEIEYYFIAYDRKLQAERDLNLAYAELTSALL